MKNKMIILKLLVILLFIILLPACGNRMAEAADTQPVQEDTADSVTEPANEDQEEPALSGKIMIAAAASLQNVIEDELIPMFNKEYPDITVIGTYDGSGKLQTQIENGLDAQIFFSAATKQMDALVDGGFIDPDTVVPLLENEVVLITGINTETQVTGFENITDAESIAVGDPASVPAGQYAEEILTSLGTWDEINSGASLGTNVTEVLKWVAEGSAEVGIVYMTDAAGMPDKVKVIATAPVGMLKTPIVYPVGLQTGLGEKAEAAEAFMSFLKGLDALRVFSAFGFKTIYLEGSPIEGTMES